MQNKDIHAIALELMDFVLLIVFPLFVLFSSIFFDMIMMLYPLNAEYCFTVRSRPFSASSLYKTYPRP